MFGPIRPSQAVEPKQAHSEAPSPQHASRQLRLGIVGDSLAVDLWHGMKAYHQERDDLELVKFAKAATGLIRDDVYDWQESLKTFVRTTKLDVIVVIIGGNDRQSVWVKGRRLNRGSKPWQTEYSRRVARFMDVLATTKAKVYWVGLPVVHSAQMSQDYRGLNQIFRAHARKHGFTYIDIWDSFVDENGAYSSFGRGPDGVRRRLRKEDGLHFTADGELRLAEVVARAIDQDQGEVKTAR